MGLITRMLKQTCVWWPLASSESGGVAKGAYGETLFSDPLEINCRWEDKSEEFLNDKDEIQISNAVVYVDRDVKKGGVLMLGELTDITDEDRPLGNLNAWKIEKFEKLPNLRVTEYLRTVYL